MSDIRTMEFWDYAVIVLKFKKILAIIFITTLFVAYGGVYFLVEEEYQASAMVISSEDNSLGGLAALAKNISSLPIGLGGVTKNTQMDLYNTIIYSRTCIETVITHFGLNQIYHFQRKEDALKAVRKMIKTEITLDNAYVVKVQVKSPQLAADMTNFLISYLNTKIIELNIAKSKDNRVFLANRYADVSANLAGAEDSLKMFQEKNGVIEAENQVKATLEVYAKMDADLVAKQMEADVLSKLYGENSPQVENAKTVVREYQRKIASMKRGENGKSTVLMDLNSLPVKALEYFRLLRTVKVYTKMLEFVVPMYEQAKFEEQKNVPILQVIDNAIPPERKSFPPRTIFALIIALSAVLCCIVFLIVREKWHVSTNPKLDIIKNELLRFRR